MSDEDAPEQLELPMKIPPAPCPQCGRIRCDPKDCAAHRAWREEARAKFRSLDWG